VSPTGAFEQASSDALGAQGEPHPAGARRVGEAMLRDPKTHNASTTLSELEALFADEHVHMALIVAPSRRLLATIERGDLLAGLPPETPAARLGTLRGRTVSPDAELAATTEALLGSGRRRLAVTDAAGELLGLLCLRRSGGGFCSDDDVGGRGAEAEPPGAAAAPALRSSRAEP
jgi:CBS-domain-containing membrane protein